MEILVIISLIIVGLLLFAVEVFLIPGISLAGIASAISMIYAIYYSFIHVGLLGGAVTLFVSILGIAALTWWFMRSKTVDKLSLKETLDYKPNPLAGINLNVGDKGITTTRLTLIGNVDFSGNILEVQSADGFIEEKTAVIISCIKDNRVYVKAIKTSL